MNKHVCCSELEGLNPDTTLNSLISSLADQASEPKNEIKVKNIYICMFTKSLMYVVKGQAVMGVVVLHFEI